MFHAAYVLLDVMVDVVSRVVDGLLDVVDGAHDVLLDVVYDVGLTWRTCPTTCCSTWA